MTTAQVVKTSVTVNNSPIQDNVHPDDQTRPTFEKRTLQHNWREIGQNTFEILPAPVVQKVDSND